MSEVIVYIVSGIVFGLSGGLTPGPLLTLVLAHSLQHGYIEGIKVAFAPLLTDVMIVIGAIYFVTEISDFQRIIGILSLLGGIYLIYLGYHIISFKNSHRKIQNVKPDSLRKGILTNFLNPNPYIFWISVGAPTVLKAARVNMLAAAGFIIAMYFFLVGSKVLLALIFSRRQNLIRHPAYIYIIRFLGVVLFIYAAMFISDAMSIILF